MNFLLDAWRRMCGMPSLEGMCSKTHPNYKDLKLSEWSVKFEQLMRNRLVMGFFRYGPFNKQNRSTNAILESIKNKTIEYSQTGNDELLVDIANLAMKEFVTGNHPNKHFNAIDDGKHVGE